MPAPSSAPLSAPSLVILAGVNGAGKSTIAAKLARLPASPGRAFNFITPDAAMQEALLGTPNPSEETIRFANKVVGETLLRQTNYHLASGHSLVLETVLASDRYFSAFATARRLGYVTTLLYLGLPSLSDSLSRISERVSKGGHDVLGDLVSWSWHQSWHRLNLLAGDVDQTIVLSCAKDPIWNAYFNREKRSIDSFDQSLPEMSTVLTNHLLSGWTLHRHASTPEDSSWLSKITP